MRNNLLGSQHIDSPDCWCRPTLYFTMDGFDGVWLHHEPDGSCPPPELIMEAIVEYLFDYWDDYDKRTGQSKYR